MDIPISCDYSRRSSYSNMATWVCCRATLVIDLTWCDTSGARGYELGKSGGEGFGRSRLPFMFLVSKYYIIFLNIKWKTKLTIWKCCTDTHDTLVIIITPLNIFLVINGPSSCSAWCTNCSSHPDLVSSWRICVICGTTVKVLSRIAGEISTMPFIL